MIDQLEGKVVAEKYRIDSLLRETESGDLYFGRHIVMDKPVLLKILAPAMAIDARFVKRFSDEAHIASSIVHPNILNVTDFGTDAKGVEYAVFEGIDGETLKDALRRDGLFAVERALRLSKQIAAAIAAAHAKMVIFGFLDPQNIFLNRDDDLTETAKVYGIGTGASGRSINPKYLSPEQCLQPLSADERSDIYSLGVILFQMLAGEVPFAGNTAAEVLAKQNNELPPPLVAFRQDLPADLEPMILSAMSKDPERRYQTMSAFAEDLDLVSIGIAAPVKEEAVVAAAPRKDLWQTAVIVLAGIIVLAGALIYATSVKQTNPTTQLQPDASGLPVQPINPATGAQEESLSKLPAMTDAEIMATAANTAALPGTIPGGDGFNAWANGGAPPPGAPLNQNIPPGGQFLSGDPNTSSPFMPSLDLVCKDMTTGKEIPCPTFNPTNRLVVKPTPPPKTPPANSAVQPSPTPVSTPKPMATPVKPAAKPVKPGDQPKTNKPKPAVTGE